MLVFGHNLLDEVIVQGDTPADVIWYILHQPHTLVTDSNHLINIVYPVLPWIGLMALGYAFGMLYANHVPLEKRRAWLLGAGILAIVLFVILRGFHLYGEPHDWRTYDSALYSLMSFLNTTKYPPSLQFLLMTMGPALVLLALSERFANRLPRPVLVFGRVPFFFYILHLYAIHALAVLFLVYQGGHPGEYILSAANLRSGRLRSFGLSLGAVYAVWSAVILLLYPICRWYQSYRESHKTWWLKYL